VADIEKAVRGIKRRNIESAVGNTARLNLLVTPQQEAEIRAAAERYDLSMTDYLIRLHELVEARVRPHRRR